MARLAQGSRSYALSKRLQGCVYPICESKLNAGQRILWTYISRDDKQHVLVHFEMFIYLYIAPVINPSELLVCRFGLCRSTIM